MCSADGEYVSDTLWRQFGEGEADHSPVGRAGDGVEALMPRLVTDREQRRA